jgi:hypothetical protein
MSWRQDNINLNEWDFFEDGPQSAYISNLQNDWFGHMQNSPHTPDMTPRAELSHYVSFNSGPPWLDQTSATAAPNTVLYEQNAPNDPRNTTWSQKLDIPRFNKDLSDHATTLPTVKQCSTNGDSGHAQCSKAATRYRQGKEVK